MMISLFQFVMQSICCILLLLSLKSTTTSTTVNCAAFVLTTTTSTTIVPSRTVVEATKTSTTTVARVASCRHCRKEHVPTYNIRSINRKDCSVSLSLLNSNQNDTYERNSEEDSIMDISNNIKNTISRVLITCLFLITATTIATTSLPVYALDPYTYTNDYNDPLHPYCKRHIEVLKDDGTKFHYTGTAVGLKNDPILRGCTPKEIELYTLRIGQFDGYIIDNGNKISAGDNIHEGIWEPAYSVSKSIPYYNIDGIRWNDGNKWTVISTKK